METEASHKVSVHVYDLSQGLARQLSFSLLGKSIEAIYHTGVVAYGREYSFGSGIESEPIGLSRYGTPFQVLDFGETEVPKDVFEEYLEDLRGRYTPENYNLLRNNCNNFSDEVVQFLVGKRIPQHILDLPREVMSTPLGASLVPFLEQMNPSSQTRQPIQTVPTSRYSQSPATTPAIPSFSRAQNVTSLTEKQPAITPTKTPTASEGKKAPTEKQNVQKTLQESDAKAAVEAEIKHEFALLMAAGQMAANEAAAQAVRRVMERYQAGTVQSGSTKA